MGELLLLVIPKLDNPTKHGVRQFCLEERRGYTWHCSVPNRPAIIQLFRDEKFVPLFGYSYDQMPLEDRQTLNRPVLWECYGLGHYQKYTKELIDYNLFFDATLLNDFIRALPFESITIPFNHT